MVHGFDRSVHSRRLDTYALRLMPLLAVNDMKTAIDVETVRKAIFLCDWQLEVRKLHDPIDADNALAKMEEKIRRTVRGNDGLKDWQIKKTPMPPEMVCGSMRGPNRTCKGTRNSLRREDEKLLLDGAMNFRAKKRATQKMGLSTGNHFRFQNSLRGEAFFLRGIPIRESGTSNDNNRFRPCF